MTDNTQQIHITGEPTLDPQVCKFIVDRLIFPDGSYNCRSSEMADGSPLLEALFGIEGIAQVMVSGNTLTIAKKSMEAWPVLGQQIGAVIREKIQSGEQLVDPDVVNRQPSEERIRRVVEQLFQEQINPAIASHGGRVDLVDVEGTKVYVRLGGGCQGCASANITMKHGIEQAIRKELPEVTEVIDATDHSSGANPYF